MSLCKSITGYNSKTPENLLLNAGAFYKNFDVDADTVDSAKAKLIGATRGGGKFNAIPTIRNIAVDGVKGKAKGLQVIENWDVKLEASVIEMTKDNIKTALMAAVETAGVDPEKYDKIQGKNCIELSDYIGNITYVGSLSGSNEPIIIQVYNALNTGGLSLETKDNNEAIAKLIFEGHYDADKDMSNPPFTIFYPKE